MELIGIIIAGIIIGLLGKLVAPGDKDNIPIWLTLLCGIGGVLIGDIIYAAFGGNGSPGIDWTRGVGAILTPAGPAGVASPLTRRDTRRPPPRHTGRAPPP